MEKLLLTPREAAESSASAAPSCTNCCRRVIASIRSGNADALRQPR